MSLDGPRLSAITGGRERTHGHAPIVAAAVLGFLLGLAAQPTIVHFLARL